ncbi:serine hydrolase [Actinocorallia sp. API 0066]|uniref:serine hydrolase domain-containing protein n=1 Tax=Actinocorallia sp. API 0066 TaxID=2896846 RepID=UPI001E501F4F|nr:serine hydrolase [Actinocorallia sp. API 0066]MCD0448905.1 serine hydrolase [Actinocorallia sp. API 0066]
MTDTLDALTRQAAARLARRRKGVAVAVVAGTETATVEADGPGAVFELGSLSKVLTALILARMAVDGRCGLDEPVADLLGVSVPGKAGEAILLRHLATHTSGLPRLPKGMLRHLLLHPKEPDPYAHLDRETLLAGLAETRLKARPGSRLAYSNLGAGLLGLALATRAGTDYRTLLRAEICAPLGMAATGVDVAGLRQGYNRGGRPVPPWNLAELAGAGGVRGTAADFLTFVRAHLDPGSTPLGPAVELALRTRRRAGLDAWIHLGWFERQGGRLWHNGATAGFTAFAGFTPGRGAGVVVLADTQRAVDGDAGRLLAALEKR